MVHKNGNITQKDLVTPEEKFLKINRSPLVSHASPAQKLKAYEAYIAGFEGTLKAERELTLHYKFKYEQLVKMLAHEIKEKA